MRGLEIMRETGWPVIFDATHSVQLPGAAGSSSGGQPLHRAAGARRRRCGVAGIFVEVHDAPERALSDGANALELDLLPGLWSRLGAIDNLVKRFPD